MAGGTGARPMGVTIIAVLAFLSGVFGLLASLALLGIGSALATVGGASLVLPGLVTLVISVANIYIGYGFWGLKPWGWRLGVILALVNPVWNLLQIILGGFSFGTLIINIIFSAIWIYYLNMPDIRKAFGAPESGLPVVGNALDPYLNKKP